MSCPVWNVIIWCLALLPLSSPCDSDGSVCVWVRSESAEEEFAAQPFGEEPLEGNKEVWAVQTTLRCVLVGSSGWLPQVASALHLV